MAIIYLRVVYFILIIFFVNGAYCYNKHTARSGYVVIAFSINTCVVSQVAAMATRIPPNNFQTPRGRASGYLWQLDLCAKMAEDKMKDFAVTTDWLADRLFDLNYST